MKSVLVIGATSAIAEQTCRCYAAQGAQLFLSARDQTRLKDIADDLRTRGSADVQTFPLDLRSPDALQVLITAVWEQAGEIDACLIAHGVLGSQEEDQRSMAPQAEKLNVNFISAALLAGEVANRMEARKSGTLAVISSVAGLRGRQSNYLYGAAKAGLNAYLQGLRNRMFPVGVRVITILPGFVATPMTAHLPTGPLFASAEKVGARIHRAMEAGKPDILYTPWFWRGIMTIIRLIPEGLFKRMKL